MQTLVFDTTNKMATLYEGDREKTRKLGKWDNVPTVQSKDGVYTVLQSDPEVAVADGQSEKRFPVLKVPVQGTNVFYEK